MDELKAEVERLQAANDALRVLKDPQQKSIPFDKAKADLRIEELEAANEVLREALQGLYEAVHTTWMNDHIEAAVAEARKALGHSE